MKPWILKLLKTATFHFRRKSKLYLPQCYTMTIKDNGVGVPDSVDFNDSTSLGLKLVKILSEQLGGKVELSRQNGSKFEISFKSANYLRRT